MADAGAMEAVRERLRAAPGALAEVGEKLLDLAVRRAVSAPLDVRDAQDVERILRDRPPDTQGAAGLILGWISGRLASRVLHLGARFALPMRVVLVAAPPVFQALRRGTFELHVLASMVVNRLHEAQVEVEPRTIRRLVLGAYLWPHEALDASRDRSSAPARLAWTWIAGAVESHGDRAVRAARRLAAADLDALVGG